MSSSVMNHKQNPEKYVKLLTVLLHFSSPEVQEGVFGEELGHPSPLTAPAVQWQCMLSGMLKGPGVVTVPATLPPSKTVTLSFKTLKPATDLTSS